MSRGQRKPPTRGFNRRYIEDDVVDLAKSTFCARTFIVDLAELAQHGRDVCPASRFGGGGRLRVRAGGAGKKRFHVRERGESIGVRGQDHLWMIGDPFSSDSSDVG